MTSRPLGLFDQEIRRRKLQALGDPLVEGPVTGKLQSTAKFHLIHCIQKQFM